MTDVADTFVHPCLICGTTVRVVGGQEQPHEHQTFGEDDSPAAYAWWQGHEAATTERDATIAAVREQVAKAKADPRADGWRHIEAIADILPGGAP